MVNHPATINGSDITKRAYCQKWIDAKTSKPCGFTLHPTKIQYKHFIERFARGWYDIHKHIGPTPINLKGRDLLQDGSPYWCEVSLTLMTQFKNWELFNGIAPLPRHLLRWFPRLRQIVDDDQLVTLYTIEVMRKVFLSREKAEKFIQSCDNPPTRKVKEISGIPIFRGVQWALDQKKRRAIESALNCLDTDERKLLGLMGVNANNNWYVEQEAERIRRKLALFEERLLVDLAKGNDTSWFSELAISKAKQKLTPERQVLLGIK